MTVAKGFLAALDSRRKSLPQAFMPILLGVLAFFGVTGGRVLWPRNIAWLTDGDARTYFLGWQFFRHSPWGNPLGSNPRYGAELSSSIAYVDNVALLALPFKAIAAWLPDPFQYFGLWILACFVLQAWFAWLLVGLMTRAPLQRLCCSGLFVFAPPFLHRLDGHYQMLGQWILLAGLYICLGPRRLSRGWAWPLLAFVVSLVHTYVTAMLLALWVADLVRRVLFDGWGRAELLQLVLVPAASLLAFWQAGLFMVGNGRVGDGFGYFRLNLVSLFDPSGWSYVLPDLPQGGGDYEGFNYLGLGLISLALLALPLLPRGWRALRARPQLWPLTGLLVGLTLFAISNQIGLGTRTFVVPIGQWLLDRANVLRGGGRMFWPVFYVLLLALLRSLFVRFRPEQATWVLLAAVAIQVVDTSAGWLPIRRELSLVGATWSSPLRASFWNDVPPNYREIRLVPPKNRAEWYDVFAYFAATHGMDTDAFYVARVDVDKLARAGHEARAALEKGHYPPGVLYVLEQHDDRVARRAQRRKVDFFGKVDGYWILAPNWGCRAACRASPRSFPDCAARCDGR